MEVVKEIKKVPSFYKWCTGIFCIFLIGFEYGFALVLVGAGIDIAGITCLGVGYNRMHKAADAYIASKPQQPAATLSLKADMNGIGLALRF